MNDAKIWIVGLLAIAGIGGMVYQLGSVPRSPYTRANYERLESGMSLDEAVAILGEPTQMYSIQADFGTVRWTSPFDPASYILGWYVSSEDKFDNFEQHGELPERAMRMPDVLPEPVVLASELRSQAHKQELERRRFLMLDPPMDASMMPGIP